VILGNFLQFLTPKTQLLTQNAPFKITFLMGYILNHQKPGLVRIPPPGAAKGSKGIQQAASKIQHPQKSP
jgi:hypothetical protein